MLHKGKKINAYHSSAKNIIHVLIKSKSNISGKCIILYKWHTEKVCKTAKVTGHWQGTENIVQTFGYIQNLFQVYQ